MADERLIAELAAVMHTANDGPHCDCSPGAREEFTVCAEAALPWLAERVRLVPDRPGEIVAECGCPITYAVAKVERHTRECGTRKAAERLARAIEEYGDA